MTKRNDFIWKALNVISWVVFVGFCIQTGALIFNYIFSLFRPVATQNLHLNLNLSAIYGQSLTLYSLLFSFIIALSALKAYVFYLVVRIFMKLNLVKPFSDEVEKLISNISYYAFSIGLIGFIAHQYAKRLLQRGYDIGVIERYWNDNGAYLMMAAILFIIAQIFKKGIEIQNENDLTV